MTYYETYQNQFREQVIKMLEANLEWLKNLEQPRQKETVDCGCKYQDIKESLQ